MKRLDRRTVATIAVALVALGAACIVASVLHEETPLTDTLGAPDHSIPAVRAATGRRPRRRSETPSAPVGAVSEEDGPATAPPSTSVRVVVRDRSRSTVPGASVTAFSGAQFDATLVDAYSSRLASTPTAADGSTWCDVVDGGRRWLHVAASRPGYVDAEAAVPLDTALRDGVEVLIERAVAVRGRCVDQDGAPVAGVRVVGPRDSAAVVADVDGRFDLRGVAESAAYVRFFPDGKPLAARRVTPTAAHDGVVDVGDVILARGGAVRGRFVDASGRPVAEAWAVLVCRDLESGFVGRTFTDADGRFAFEHVGDGTLDVCMTRPDFPLEAGSPSAWAYDVRAGGDEVVVRVPGDHYVHVRWLDDDGRPAGFFGGRITWFAVDDASERVDYSGLGNGWTFFHIPARPGAAYEVRMELDGFEPLTTRVTGTEEKDHVVDAVLRRRAR